MNNDVIYNSNSITLEEFLKNSYEKIWESVKKEDYNLDFQHFDEFYEIPYENEIVGFIAVEKSNKFNTKSIVDCYIKPEKRGNNLLYKALIKLISSTHYYIISKKPTRSFILALLHYGLAYKISENLIISWFDFEVKANDLYKNSKIKKLYKKIDENSDVSCHADLFDLECNSLIILDSDNLMSKNSAINIISEPRKYDLKKFNSRKKLKKVSVNYLENINDVKVENITDFLNFFNDLNFELNQYFTVDNIIGSEDKLNDDVVEFLNENHISLEDGFKIRQDIINALNDEEIINTFIKFRFEFLVSNREYIGKTIDKKDNNNHCPFCEKGMDIFYTCRICGHQFDSIKHPSEIIDDMDDGKSIDVKDLLSMEDFDPGEFSPKNLDFISQFNEFNEKLSDFLGDNYDKFFESIQNGDFNTFDKILNDKSNLHNADWYFKEGNKLDNWILNKIHEKNYDEFEVYESQSRIATYEYVKHIHENITPWKMESLNKLNHIRFDMNEYAINHGYLKKISGDEFADYLNQYSTDELIEELAYFDISPKKSKDDIINQLMDEGEFSLLVTEKGLDYLKSNLMLDFFADYLSEFLFYEFEIYYNLNKEDLSIHEIAEEYLNNEFKNAVKSGNLDVYLNYLEYYYKVNFDEGKFDQSLVYLIQRLIYEINIWYSKDNHTTFELGVSLKTGSFFNQLYKLGIDFNLEESFNIAFKEFKFGHLKQNREKIYDFAERLISGQHLMYINDNLLDEYFN